MMVSRAGGNNPFSILGNKPVVPDLYMSFATVVFQPGSLLEFPDIMQQGS
jgi:hypothetical protein